MADTVAPSASAPSVAETATTEAAAKDGSTQKATGQSMDPFSVVQPVDEEGNVCAIQYKPQSRQWDTSYFGKPEIPLRPKEKEKDKVRETDTEEVKAKKIAAKEKRDKAWEEKLKFYTEEAEEDTKRGEQLDARFKQVLEDRMRKNLEKRLQKVFEDKALEALDEESRQALLEKSRTVTAELHRWFRRRLFFSHREFDQILTCYEKGEPFMLYTGRGPSSGSMHLGHTIPFLFTKWLQEVFDVPLVIMLTDDEKFLWRNELTIPQVQEFARENAKDIIALGFDVKKTFIYQDTEYVGGHFYHNALEFARAVTYNQVNGAFGFEKPKDKTKAADSDSDSDSEEPKDPTKSKDSEPSQSHLTGQTNIGKIFYPSLQCVAAFPTSYPEIWGDDPKGPRSKKPLKSAAHPCAIDQDPYFRLVRKFADRTNPKSTRPALLHSQFLTGLKSFGGKMSASEPDTAIFLSDTPAQIKKKINSAFSGGGETLEIHKRDGGNPGIDVPYTYIGYFEDDDEKWEELGRRYATPGGMMSGEMKKICIEMLQGIIGDFQEKRRGVTDEVLRGFMTPRKLEWSMNGGYEDGEGKTPAAGEKKDAAGEKSEKVDAPEKKTDAPEKKKQTKAEKKQQQQQQKKPEAAEKQ